MTGYGRSRTKIRRKSNVLLSPTKHLSTDNVSQIPKHEKIPLPSIAVEHSNPISVSNITNFQSFEDLENQRPTKKQKLGSTTIFSLRSNSSSERDSTSSQFSGDEFSSQVSNTLEKMNDRYHELEIEANKHKDDSSVISNYNRTIEVIQGQNEPFNHYGSTRSYQAEKKSLSASESESESENDFYKYTENRKVDAFDGGIDPESIQIRKVESFSELKSSGKMLGSKLEFAMICEQLKKWLDDDSKSTELLAVKLDLIIKIKTDVNFRTYLEKSIISKFKSNCYTLLEKLLTRSITLPLANLQLINFFKIKTIDTSLFIDSLTCTTSFLEHVKSAHLHKKLVKDIANDWVKACADTDPYTVILYSLDPETFEDYDDKQKNNTAFMVTCSLDSSDRYNQLLGLKYLRGISVYKQGTKFYENFPELSSLAARIDYRDTDRSLLAFEVVINLIYSNGLAYSMFNHSTWDSLWRLLQTKDFYKTKDEAKQKQCILIIAHILCFAGQIDLEDEGNHVKILKHKLNSALISKTSFTNLEKNYLGYLGYLGYKFLEDQSQSTKESLLIIKKILTIFKTANPVILPITGITKYIDKILMN